MSGSDSKGLGIFGSAAPAALPEEPAASDSKGHKRAKPAPEARERRLKEYNTVPAKARNTCQISKHQESAARAPCPNSQVLNPCGASPELEWLDLHDFYKMAENGNDYIMHYSELCDKDPQRVGIGLSRFAQTMLDGIENLRHPDVADVVKPDLLKAALAEAATLEPHFKNLDFGKDMDGGDTRRRQRCSARRGANNKKAMRT